MFLLVLNVIISIQVHLAGKTPVELASNMFDGDKHRTLNPTHSLIVSWKLCAILKCVKGHWKVEKLILIGKKFGHIKRWAGAGCQLLVVVDPIFFK